jgi:hypothetical protein
MLTVYYYFFVSISAWSTWWGSKLILYAILSVLTLKPAGLGCKWCKAGLSEFGLRILCVTSRSPKWPNPSKWPIIMSVKFTPNESAKFGRNPLTRIAQFSRFFAHWILLVFLHQPPSIISYFDFVEWKLRFGHYCMPYQLLRLRFHIIFVFGREQLPGWKWSWSIKIKINEKETKKLICCFFFSFETHF